MDALDLCERILQMCLYHEIVIYSVAEQENYSSLEAEIEY